MNKYVYLLNLIIGTMVNESKKHAPLIGNGAVIGAEAVMFGIYLLEKM